MSERINWKGRPVVYRCYSADGRLIYVGSTVDLRNRMNTHLKGRFPSFWSPLFRKIRITICSSEPEAREMEKRVIRDEAPRFNVRHQRPLELMTREQLEDYITAIKSGVPNSGYIKEHVLPSVMGTFRSRFPQAVTA